MSDEVLTVKLTAREIDLLHQCISTNIETVKRRHDVTGSTADLIQELGELSDDLLEQRFRPEDPDMPALKFVPPGTMKGGSDAATSRAAERRNFNLKGPDPKLSKTQTHDVWDANDPKNW